MGVPWQTRRCIRGSTMTKRLKSTAVDETMCRSVKWKCKKEKTIRSPRVLVLNSEIISSVAIVDPAISFFQNLTKPAKICARVSRNNDRVWVSSHSEACFACSYRDSYSQSRRKASPYPRPASLVKRDPQIWLRTFVREYRLTRTELTKNWFHAFLLSTFVFV